MTNSAQLSNLETAAVGSPITRLGVSFFPVYLMGGDLPEIATGRDSGLQIKELDDPAVPTLLAQNPTCKPILVVEGQHFLGGKQNRTINGTVLVPAMTKLEIPVSCLEQGRWGRAEAYQQAETFAPRRVRLRKEESVNQSMRQSGSRQGDQGAVWDEVDHVLCAAGTHSDTSAASVIDDVYRRETGPGRRGRGSRSPRAASRSVRDRCRSRAAGRCDRAVRLAGLAQGPLGSPDSVVSAREREGRGTPLPDESAVTHQTVRLARGTEYAGSRAWNGPAGGGPEDCRPSVDA